MINEQICFEIISSINRTLDPAIYQSGKLVWFDLREVLTILKKDKKSK